MRVLRIMGLGLIIWALSLWWPEVNHILTEARITRAVMGLSGATLIYLLGQYLDWYYNHFDSGQSQTIDQTFALYTLC